MAETARNHIFSKEISQVIIAAMVLTSNFYWKNCLRVISAMRGNPAFTRAAGFGFARIDTQASW